MRSLLQTLKLLPGALLIVAVVVIRRVLRLDRPNPLGSKEAIEQFDLWQWVSHGYPRERWLPPGHPHRAARLAWLDTQRDKETEEHTKKA